MSIKEITKFKIIDTLCWNYKVKKHSGSNITKWHTVDKSPVNDKKKQRNTSTKIENYKFCATILKTRTRECNYYYYYLLVLHTILLLFTHELHCHIDVEKQQTLSLVQMNKVYIYKERERERRKRERYRE